MKDNDLFSEKDGLGGPPWQGALRVMLFYTVVAGLWILFSDRLLLAWAGSERALAWQTPKGWFFVLVTAGLLFWLLLRELHKQHRSAEAIKQAKERWHTLVEAANDAIVVADAQSGIILEVNRQAETLLGRPRQELVGQSQTCLHPADQSQRYSDRFHQAVAQGGGVTEELEVQHADGRCIPVEISARVARLNQRDVLIGIFHNLTKRRERDLLIRQLSRAVRQSPALILITDTEGQIEYVNPRFGEVTGYGEDEVLGTNVRLLKSERTSPDRFRELWTRLQGGHIWRGTFCNRKKNGDEFWVSASISPITDERGAVTHFVAVQEDITEQRLLEKKFLRAQRMESIGTLAGGVAHDLNNILSPVLMASELMRSKASPAQIELLQMIEASAQRGANLVKQLLTFARGAEGERVLLQPHHLVKEVADLLGQTLPKSISVKTNLPRDLWLVRGDATQLHQVLLNLCVNARDAMPTGGRLSLICENQNPARTDPEMPEARPGPYVVLSVTDTGCGIPPEMRERIFDPFFTTKEPGKGTGLGLSTVLGIVKSHGGFILVQSEPDQGTTFRVFLPAAREGEAGGSNSKAQTLPQGQGQWILVVDDEATIRRLLQDILEQHGFHVLTAANGSEAGRQLDRHRDKIEMIITDLMMPVMDGPAFIGSLADLGPRIPVIAMSGIDAGKAQRELANVRVDAFMQKPFTSDNILHVVHDLLN